MGWPLALLTTLTLIAGPNPSEQYLAAVAKYTDFDDSFKNEKGRFRSEAVAFKQEYHRYFLCGTQKVDELEYRRRRDGGEPPPFEQDLKIIKKNCQEFWSSAFQEYRSASLKSKRGEIYKNKTDNEWKHDFDRSFSVRIYQHQKLLRKHAPNN